MSVPPGKTVVACLIVLVVTSGVGTAALPERGSVAADAGERAAGASDTDEDDPTVRARFAFSQHPDPGVVTVRATFIPPSNVRSLEVAVPSRLSDRLEITNATGFSSEADADTWTWEPDPPSPMDPSLTMRYEVNESGRVFDGLNFVATDAWALFDSPRLEVGWSYRGTPPTYEYAAAIAGDETGYATPTMGYLGAYETHETTRNGQRFTLVVPASAESASPSAVFETLETASRWLDVGDADDGVVVFRGPGPLRHGGLAKPADRLPNDSAPDSFWVSETATGDDPTYVSEYVHTRQAYDETDRMAWITEAQDVYFSSLVALYRNTYSYEQFRFRVATDASADAVLAPEDRSASRTRADYQKGARVLAALDAEIRRSTERNRSVEDVWREMNAHEGSLNYTDFKDIVADVAGRSLDGWLDRYLTTPAVPEVPDDRTLYAPIESGIDGDDDGLVTREELDAGTDPFVADTDGDGLDDGEELDRGTDPLRASDEGESSDSESGDGTEVEDDEGTGTAGSADSGPEDADHAGTRTAGGTDADDGGDSRDESDEREAPNGDPAGDPVYAAIVLGLTGVTGGALLVAVLTVVARALNSLVGVAPGILVRRSVRRLVALAVGAAALLVAYVVRFS